MPFKDNDYVPRLWSYDTTGEAVVLSQRELKSLRDELNKEYLRRWSGYMNGVHSSSQYMDYTSPSTEFTDSDGHHIHRLPDWNSALPTPNRYTSNDPQYSLADGNVQNSYWGARARKDFRGCPIWYGPMDRYVDGKVNYNPASNSAPTVTSDYKGPTAGMTLPLGTSVWKDENGNDPNKSYNPFGFKDVTKDRSFKHLIDGLANIVDIDKYFGHGIESGDPIVPYNPVNYGKEQDPHNAERTEHLYRNTGNVTLETPGSEERLTRASSIASWIPILKSEQRNEFYLRACNYQHHIWYFRDVSYNTAWSYSASGTLQASMPSDGSWSVPGQTGGTSLSYNPTAYANRKDRVNYNPSYYGHREAYTSCLTACTGFCSQTCFHVCDEQCVYLCDDKCGYSCMDGGHIACGSVCIANCRDNCGGPTQEGGGGANSCQSSCSTGAKSLPNSCSGQCSGNCSGFAKDAQACGNNCVGYCSDSCETICTQSCKFNCSSSQCMISCAASCNSKAGESQGCCSNSGKIAPRYENLPDPITPTGDGSGGGSSGGVGKKPSTSGNTGNKRPSRGVGSVEHSQGMVKPYQIPRTM